MTKRILIGFIVLLLLAACGQETPAPTAAIEATTPAPAASTFTPSPLPPTGTATLTPTETEIPLPTETLTPVVYGPNNMPLTINPLTGLPPAARGLLDRRPVAVKINIVPRNTRPAWGLSLADIVYDYYHNDGYTRFHAIFYGNDAELAGPIRSGRLLDHELVRMYASVFAYGSADQIINNRLLNSDYSNRVLMEGQRSNCPPTAAAPLCRFEPSGSDLLLGSTQAISQYFTNQGVENGRQALAGMTFDPTAPTGGAEGSQLFVRYSGDSYVRWDYNPITGSYLRFQDNVYDQGQGEEYAPLTDRLNDEQIAAQNVVVIVARHEYYQRPPAEIVEILLSGTGKAYAFRDGQVYEVVWNRPTINSVLYLTYPDGTAFPFKPGNTWFQVVGEASALTQPEPGTWRWVFSLP